MAEVDQKYLKEIEKARRELRALISGNKGAAPLMYQLAWHDAGTYDAEKEKEGPMVLSGSGLNMRRLKSQLEKVSYADLYQLAGVVAVEVTGGPIIDFTPGRKDSLESPQGGRLPDANQDARDLRNTFSRMGLSDDKDIVALCGGLRTMYLGKTPGGETTEDKTHEDNIATDDMKSVGEKTSVPEVEWPGDHLKFDNTYFVYLSSNNKSLMIPMDHALATDTKFLQYVDVYVKDMDAFSKIMQSHIRNSLS
ncbi:L-ascorbate peroxidase 3 [Spatholobus suberectus]|nr:L-ascorbate peroxidase 3 [Spatholobus suberectus]